MPGAEIERRLPFVIGDHVDDSGEMIDPVTGIWLRIRAASQ